jgi:hypothetical protein
MRVEALRTELLKVLPTAPRVPGRNGLSSSAYIVNEPASFYSVLPVWLRVLMRA